MAYAELTPEQKEAVDALTTFIRGQSGQFAQLLTAGRAIASAYVGNVETILSQLAPSDEIPNTSGLDGAQPLTKEQLVNLIGYYLVMSDPADGASGPYGSNYHRALYVRAAGINGVV